MLLKLKKIFATDLVKVSSLNAVAVLIRMMTGFISNKIVAIRILAPGVAIFGQLSSFASLIQAISQAGINNGITKYLAQYSDSKKRYSLFLSTGVRITASVAATCGLVLIIGSRYFASHVLKNPDYTSVFFIFGFTVILYALNQLLLSILNGFREFKKYVLVNITNSVAGLLFVSVLTYFFGLYGTLVGFVSYQSIVFLVTFTLVYRSPWFTWKLLFGPFSKLAAIRLSKFSQMQLVSTSLLPLTQYIVRSALINRSVTEAGFWSGMINISNMYLMVVTTSLSVYYLPRISGLKNDLAIKQEVLYVYKYLVPFLIIVSGLIYLFRHLIISILYTNTFQPMEDLFGFQMIGDVIKMSTWVLGYILVAKAMARTYIIVEVISAALMVSFSLLFIHFFGTIGATMGYAMAWLSQLLIMIFILRKLLFAKK